MKEPGEVTYYSVFSAASMVEHISGIDSYNYIKTFL